MKALIVDDSAATRSFIRRILEDLGYETVEAADGDQGLELVQQDPSLDVVLVDFNMPGMDGISLIRSIRDAPDRKRLRLVMITTEAALERVREALGAGADEYVMKPFTQDILEEKLRLIGLGA